MHQVFHIFRKEFKSYFVSPIAYIVITIFLLVNGWFFFSTFFLYGQATLRNFFNLLPVVFSFFVPAVTIVPIIRVRGEAVHVALGIRCVEVMGH